MTELFRRIHYLLNRRRIAKELEDEMDFHRSMSGRDGKPFGNELRLREESRDAWGWTWMDRTVQDVRYALRTMRRSPGFSLAAVLMLAVGIGVNVAAFGFFNIVMLRPLPVRHPDSLVRFHRVAPGEYASDVPYPVFKFYADHTRTLSAVLAMDSGFLSAEAEEKPLRAFFVSGNFLRELGAKTAAGRLFTEDPKEGEPLVTVLGNNYWKAHFGGDPSVVGRTMRLNGRAVLVIGVVGEEFSGLTYSAPALWIPLVQQPSIVSGSKLLTSYSAAEDGVDMWGRVRSGETAESVAQEMSVLAAELRKQRPNDIWKDERLSVEPGAYAQNAGGRDRGSSPSPSLQARMYPVFGLIGALTLLILTVTCG
ncbi:MAG TPA: ABC transporter permease, partial [Bryobacteraceae bacterium]|nr:ABC transporter permease [Bryobacteraceae bacterium]